MLYLNSNWLNIIARSAAVFLVTLCMVFFTNCSQEKREPPKARPPPTGSVQRQKTDPQIDIHNAIAVIETAKGTIEIEFFADAAPKATGNFIKNTRLGYYNNEPFHRVEPGLLIQAGSPLVTDTIPIETSDLRPVRGVAAMAKEEGAIVADAVEFFICLDTLELDGAYAMFGKVAKGLDVIDKIKQGDKILKITIRKKD